MTKKKFLIATLAILSLAPLSAMAQSQASGGADHPIFKLHVDLTVTTPPTYKANHWGPFTVGHAQAGSIQRLDSSDADDRGKISAALKGANPCVIKAIADVKGKLESIKTRADYGSALAGYQKACGKEPDLQLALFVAGSVSKDMYGRDLTTLTLALGHTADGKRMDAVIPLLHGSTTPTVPYSAYLDNPSCSGAVAMANNVDVTTIGNDIVNSIKAQTQSCSANKQKQQSVSDIMDQMSENVAPASPFQSPTSDSAGQAL